MSALIPFFICPADTVVAFTSGLSAPFVFFVLFPGLLMIYMAELFRQLTAHAVSFAASDYIWRVLSMLQSAAIIMVQKLNAADVVPSPLLSRLAGSTLFIPVGIENARGVVRVAVSRAAVLAVVGHIMRCPAWRLGTGHCRSLLVAVAVRRWAGKRVA